MAVGPLWSSALRGVCSPAPSARCGRPLRLARVWSVKGGENAAMTWAKGFR